MNYLKFDLGKAAEGKTVKVTLSGSMANIRLMNKSNMYNYEHGHDYTSIDELAQKVLTEIRIPENDHWFVVVDLKGIRGKDGRIDASVRVD